MTDTTLAAYAASLAPTLPDRTEVSSRRASVERILRASSLRVTGLFESGSWTHGTGVNKHSDVDYMAKATGQRPAWPSSALSTAKSAISGSDWRIAKVGTSSPIVAIAYTSVPNFEVAPAWHREVIRGFDVYWIAGRRDEWVASAPAAHLAYVDRQNNRLGKRVKPLVRLLKAWKYNCAVPTSSFYLEMRAAEYCQTQNSIVYEIDFAAVLRTLISNELRDMNDPMSIVGRIPACSSDEKRQLSQRQAQLALELLSKASLARGARDAGGYWTNMRQIFGQDYPWPMW